MALRQKSLFLYGLQVTSSNSSMDFKNASLGSQISATLRTGYYSLDGLMTEVVRAMNAADPSFTYTYSIDRTFSSGTQNRVTITTSGTFMSLLFATGTRAATTCAILLGYTATDKTGATFYQSQGTAGTALAPTEVGYTYIPVTMEQKIIGSVNISAQGDKETITYATHKFFEVEFKYEAETKVINEWSPFMNWASMGKPMEFTPDTTAPSTVIDCTLEKTQYDSKGMGFKLMELLPDFPFFYRTGLLTFRQKPVPVSFL